MQERDRIFKATTEVMSGNGIVYIRTLDNLDMRWQLIHRNILEGKLYSQQAGRWVNVEVGTDERFLII